ncbi:MAG: hypothetical protein ABIH42_09640, partial [Planctomycetota bacterium]
MSPLFCYHAKDQSGIDREGTLEASNEADVAKKLQEQSLYAISIKTIAKNSFLSELKRNLILVEGLLFLGK